MSNRIYLVGITLMYTSMMLSGCIFSDSNKTENNISELQYPSIFDRHNLDFQDNHTFSYVLEKGPYSSLEVEEAFIEVDTSDIWETGPETSTVHLSYWLPNNTLKGDKVPVIAIISPYFSYGLQGAESTPTNIVSTGRGEFIFDNFLPHGYAFAQVSVFGTELSSGCFDYRGAGEGLGIHHAVEWLGKQNWSNGNVGLYGKSYEGATQWEAAALASPHLKTIVPISGTTALHPLLYKNGSAEARSQIMHMNYFSSTVDYDEDDLDNVCPDIIEGLFAGPITYGAGELDPYMSNYYDERSHIDKAFQNWNGSVYWVQGLQDWNVDPHQVFGGPVGFNWYQDYIDAGYEIRGIFGQWEHNYPDQWTKHNEQESGYGGEAIENMTRWDWAQDLFEWYEYYLKEKGPKPDFFVQVQRNDGQWRIEDTWPPKDIEWINYPLSQCSNSDVFIGGGAPVVGGGQSVEIMCPALSETNNTLISGLIRLHLEAIASFDGGQIFAELQDIETGLRLGHATMDIRYHAGGNDPQTVIPNQQLTMMMEFQAIDALLPAGHGLKIVLTDTGEDYLAPACGSACIVHILPSSSTMYVPEIARNGSNILHTYQNLEAANN